LQGLLTVVVKYWHLLTKTRYEGEVVRGSDSRPKNRGEQGINGESSQTKVLGMFPGSLAKFREAKALFILF